MRELSAHEMNAVAGGFSLGSCSVGASYSSSRDGHGGSSTSMSVHADCGLNAPDGSRAGNSGKGGSNKSGSGRNSNDRGGKH